MPWSVLSHQHWCKGPRLLPPRAIFLSWGRKMFEKVLLLLRPQLFIISLGVTARHSCFFFFWKWTFVRSKGPTPQKWQKTCEGIPKFRFGDLNRPRGVEWPVLFFVYWSCTAQVGSTDELRGAFCVNLQSKKLAEIWDIRFWITNQIISFLSISYNS